MISLKSNLIANCLSQFYVAFVGIVVLPLYIQYLGAEAYGLVGFFLMLQMCFNLLDLGLTPTIARESARYFSGAMDAESFRGLLRLLYRIFLVIASLGALFFFSSAAYIGSHWLKAQELSLETIQNAIEIMAFCIALRWMSGFYKSIITGAEAFLWLGGFNAIIASLRFLLVLPVMAWFGASIAVFFNFQFVVALLELLVFYYKAQGFLPKKAMGRPATALQDGAKKSIFKFSLIIAFTSSVWILVSQLDKIILSKILPLKEYGYFTVAVMVASGIVILSTPLVSTLMPRLVKLEAEKNPAELLRVYRQFTRIMVIIAGSAAITLCFCAKPLLLMWFGDAKMAEAIAPILSLYAIGNGLLALAAFPYYLQYAKGNLRLHFIGHIILLLLLIPGFMVFASFYGAIGAACVWALVNALYFFIWVAISHRKWMPGLHLHWFIKDIMCTILPVSLIAALISHWSILPSDRLGNLCYVLGFGLSILALSVACNLDFFNFFKTNVMKRFLDVREKI